jgi:uncharacterized protein YbaR (Trm112 family)
MNKLKREQEEKEKMGIFVCPYCKGTGEEVISYKGHNEISECEVCRGTGRFVIPEEIMEKIRQRVKKEKV